MNDVYCEHIVKRKTGKWALACRYMIVGATILVTYYGMFLLAFYGLFLGLILSLPKLAGADFSIDYYGFGPLAILLLVVVVTALFFTTILTIVSTYAKSVKEATSLSGPLTIIVMVVGMSGMMATSANTNLWMYLIPIYNSIQSFTGILNDSINIFAIIITVISNLAYIGLGVFLLTKMFNSEKIMFNK